MIRATVDLVAVDNEGSGSSIVGNDSEMSKESDGNTVEGDG